MITELSFIENISNHLKQGKMEITFTKKNGEIRTLTCTLSPEFLPEIKNPDRESSNESLAVFDLESKSWKSFIWDSVKSVHYL